MEKKNTGFFLGAQMHRQQNLHIPLLFLVVYMAAVVWRCFLCVAFKYGVDLNSFPSLHIPPMGYHALFLNLLKLGGVSQNKIKKKEQVGFKAGFSKALSPDGC